MITDYRLISGVYLLPPLYPWSEPGVRESPSSCHQYNPIFSRFLDQFMGTLFDTNRPFRIRPIITLDERPRAHAPFVVRANRLRANDNSHKTTTSSSKTSTTIKQKQQQQQIYLRY